MSNPKRGAFAFLVRTVVALAALGFCLAPAARALSPATEATIDEGLKPLYNLDYAQARARVHRLIEIEPDNPYGYLFEASAIWWQSDNEYSLFKDTPTLEDLFEFDIAQALSKSSAMLKTARDDHQQAEIHFALGMAYGIRGQWSLLRGRWIKAYFDGRKAVKHLHRCLKHDPEFYDAYLGLGIYDYQADKLPRLLKLSAILMVRGNARRGIERLQLAMERGRYVHSQAAGFLNTLCILHEHDYARALAIVRRLRNLYPDSPYFQFREATTLYRMGDFEDSYRATQGILDRVPGDPALIHQKLLSLLCGLTGEHCLSPEEVSTAIGWLTQALETENAKRSPRKTLLYFYRGVAYDMAGKRDMAVDDYKRVLALQPVSDVQETARRCLRDDCSREEVLRMIKSMSLGSPAESSFQTSTPSVSGTGKGFPTTPDPE